MEPVGIENETTVRAAIDAAAEAIAAAGCEEPRGDAEALVADALGVDLAQLSADGAGELSAELAAAIGQSVRRRAEHEPLAYILGHEEFRGIDVAVDDRVLIPRRETGLLVEVAAKLPEGARVHEVGTGSGAVALALLNERPDLRVTASDLSPEAVDVAHENAARLELDLEVTVDEGLPDALLEADIDMVLANLPYVTDSTIFERSPEIRREPRIAVTGDCGEDGLGVIRGVLSEIPSGWRVAFEHDTHHGPALREMLSDAETLRDHMGGERVTRRHRSMSEADAPPDQLEGTASERRAKVERLRAAGIDPFPRNFPDRTKIEEILDAHDPAEVGEGDHPDFTYRVAGRLTGQRGHGKTAFFDIRDLSGTIQAYARLDSLGEEAYARVEDLDVGDLVGVEGDLYVTKRGQLALSVRECVLLAPALRDPPDLFHGISDPETRYRQRELDLMANERSREIFSLRSRVLTALRDHMNEHGYVELETPILQRLPGGAAARPFKTHHHALDRHLFLRTATELYLKRAIVGGFDDVYELGRFFRNEGMSPQHNPEFTMLEWFVAFADYNGVMAFAERLVADVVERIMGTTKIEHDGQTIDFAPPWPRLPIRDAILEETGVDIVEASRDDLAEMVGSDAEPGDDWAGLVDRLQGKLIEPKIVQPTFIVDMPLDLWPLVKPCREHPRLLGEAFDGLVAGMEIVGGGTDINDPIEQRARFVRQRERQEQGAEETPHPHDEEFVRALEYGMPPASGCGLGVDRLMMLLTGARTLRDVVLFPSMREAPGETSPEPKGSRAG